VANDALETTEKEWQAQVVALARTLGWHGLYHVFDSRRSASGFPDLVLVRERVVYVELKSETGKVSPAQKQWIGWLLDAGAEVYVARPRDLEALGVVLGSVVHSRQAPLALGLLERTRDEIDC